MYVSHSDFFSSSDGPHEGNPGWDDYVCVFMFSVCSSPEERSSRTIRSNGVQCLCVHSVTAIHCFSLCPVCLLLSLVKTVQRKFASFRQTCDKMAPLIFYHLSYFYTRVPLCLVFKFKFSKESQNFKMDAANHNISSVKWPTCAELWIACSFAFTLWASFMDVFSVRPEEVSAQL